MEHVRLEATDKALELTRLTSESSLSLSLDGDLEEIILPLWSWFFHCKMEDTVPQRVLTVKLKWHSPGPLTS